MKTIRLRSSSLDTYATCQKKAVAEWFQTAEPEKAAELGIKPRRQHIGAVVGRGVHEGVAFLMNELKSTGSHGGALRVRHASAACGQLIAEETKTPLISDTTTPTPTKAVKAATRILERYHQDIRPETEPNIVEQALSMIVTLPNGKEVEVTGTLDRYHIIGGLLRDTKTGTNRPSSIAQQGSYILLLRNNGFLVDSAALDYAKRCKEFSPQPPIEVIDIPILEAQLHAMAIIVHLATTIYDCLDRGDLHTAVANPGPMNMLCSAKFCSAWDSEACQFGPLLRK